MNTKQKQSETGDTYALERFERNKRSAAAAAPEAPQVTNETIRKQVHAYVEACKPAAAKPAHTPQEAPMARAYREILRDYNDVAAQNKKLFAQREELLAALKALLENTEYNMTEEQSFDHAMDAHDQDQCVLCGARAAIAAAEGSNK